MRYYATKKKCPINLPHDFDDYPCRLCSGEVITERELSFKLFGFQIRIIIK